MRVEITFENSQFAQDYLKIYYSIPPNKFLMVHVLGIYVLIHK